MILLAGIRSESPLALVAAALRRRGAAFRFVHQRDVADHAIAWRIDERGVTGILSLGAERIALEEVTGLYTRMMDDRLLPELDGLGEDHPARRHARAFHDSFFHWSEIAPGRVVNRAEPQGSNGSKPYQAQLIARHGFLVPPTLITNDPEAVLAFRRTHGALVYKSISAVRSIVKRLDADDIARLDAIRWCAVQFQAAIEGINVRVHVVGEKVFATEIASTHVDYRYAHVDGGETRLSAVTLPRAVRARCIALSRELDLPFSGIDLMRTPRGDYYCFEVNPQPGFSYYQGHTGQPIATAVARYLAGG
ncbi:MAG: glutathione synthase [Alphaproteobacteria bacterium]|nr:glutathione synthase [Alphaproteobacteria bacterium]